MRAATDEAITQWACRFRVEDPNHGMGYPEMYHLRVTVQQDAEPWPSVGPVAPGNVGDQSGAITEHLVACFPGSNEITGWYAVEGGLPSALSSPLSYESEVWYVPEPSDMLIAGLIALACIGRIKHGA